jgi:hypothetical protein
MQIRIFCLFLEYIRGILFSIFAVSIFGLITLTVINTPLEITFINLLSITPGIGLGKNGVFDINNNSVVSFFGFWGAIIAVINMVLKRQFKIRLHVKFTYILLSVAVLHLVALFMLATKTDFQFILFFVTLLFFINLVTISVYFAIGRLISILSKAVSTTADVEAHL